MAEKVKPLFTLLRSLKHNQFPCFLLTNKTLIIYLFYGQFLLSDVNVTSIFWCNFLRSLIDYMFQSSISFSFAVWRQLFLYS